jgi:hypothetical protein
MAADPNLLAAFDTAYDWFNQHNFTEQSWAQTMEGLLDDNVTMKRLDDSGYHEGKAAIKNYYLYGHGLNDQASITFRNKDCEVIGNFGFISGLADFVDLDGANHTPPSRSRLIAYSFAYSKASGSWKAVYFWGAYVTTR